MHATSNRRKDEQPRPNGRLIVSAVAALGVVFGDIGTSPLYALRQCFFGVNAVPVSPSNVLGILSLIFWSLMIVISVKYMLFVMRQDNHGEGGIIALVALLIAHSRDRSVARILLVPLGLFGAALLYGDGSITPAISVLSAIEGLAVVSSNFAPAIVPLTVAILVALFWLQKKGTQHIGQLFGPLMLVWFVTIAVLGFRGVLLHPAVIQAIFPAHAIAFFAENGIAGFLVLGTVFLVVTGGEALYADMGHFGLRTIKIPWFLIVLPALLLNYFGQGALVLSDAAEASHPFFHLAPAWFQYPLIVIATLATIIASQAVITGTFSLTAQAIRLDFLPRMRVIHTSAEEVGQVYIPAVNWLLMAATIALVLGFRSSDNLGAAYGLAVSADMVITTVLAAFVAIRHGWHPLLMVTGASLLWAVDLSFAASNIFKIVDGGWYPLLVGTLIFILMRTWWRGRHILRTRLQKATTSWPEFFASLNSGTPARIPGTAVFLTSRMNEPPPILTHHLHHHGVLHEQVILLNVHVHDIPRVPAAGRLAIDDMSNGFRRIVVNYGYLQSPNIPTALHFAQEYGLQVNLDETVYYLGRETVIPTDDGSGMAVWREHLFAFLSRNASRATAFYDIPPERVVELGIQIEI